MYAISADSLAALRELARCSLNENQRLLLEAIRESNGSGMNATQLLAKLEQERGVPNSTLRLNLSLLKKKGLVEAGDSRSKGLSVSLTRIGQLVVGGKDG